MKKILLWLLVGLVTIVLIIFIGAFLYLKSTLPQYDGELTATGITAEVEIIRDPQGMPHIYAANDHDAYFALGFCMAQDRLFQLDMVRRTVRGQLAEVLGASLIDADKLFRTITAPCSPEEMVEALPVEVQNALHAFTDGINYYLHRQNGSLPIEFKLIGYQPEDWRAGDCAAVLYYLAWMLNFSFGNELLHAAVADQVGLKEAAKLFVPYPDGYPTIIPASRSIDHLALLQTFDQVRELVGGSGRGASNSWVVAGSKSTTGKPLLANDMHLGLGLPGIWYEAHLSTPQMNVSGVLPPGVPFVVVGANDHVAWGFTNAMADDTDYYREKINPADSNQYEYRGVWEKMVLKTDTILVKDTASVPFPIRLTRHGPVISELLDQEFPPDEALTMRWTLYDTQQESYALYLLNRATNIAEVDRAAEYFKCPGQNWVFADDQGNIGYRAAVSIPIRNNFSGALPLPGWDGEHEWSGYVPFAEQPHMFNPARGWIASANNQHCADDYPYPISHYYSMPDRIVRIERMLQEKDKFQATDFARMQGDLYLVLAEEWVPLILEALADEPLAQHPTAAREILKEWEFDAGIDETGSSIFHTTVGFLLENTFRSRLGEELYRQYLNNVWRAHNSLRQLIAGQDTIWFDNPETSERETLDSQLRLSFIQAVEYLVKRLGDDPGQWQWGQLHTLTFSHPVGRASRLAGRFLNRGPFPIGGGVATVSPSPYRLPHGWHSFAGASMRYIIDLGKPANSRGVIPTGISGNFFSDHYDDQLELWRNIEYRPFLLQRSEVENNAKYTLRLIPQ